MSTIFQRYSHLKYLISIKMKHDFILTVIESKNVEELKKLLSNGATVNELDKLERYTVASG
jgi:hypothetical protein